MGGREGEREGKNRVHPFMLIYRELGHNRRIVTIESWIVIPQ